MFQEEQLPRPVTTMTDFKTGKTGSTSFCSSVTAVSNVLAGQNAVLQKIIPESAQSSQEHANIFTESLGSAIIPCMSIMTSVPRSMPI